MSNSWKDQLPKIAIGVVAAAAAGYLLYKTMGGEEQTPEEESKKDEAELTLKPSEIKEVKEEAAKVKQAEIQEAEIKLVAELKELDMFGFLDSNGDKEALIKAIQDWIPKALKKYLGQSQGELVLPAEVTKDVFTNISTVMRNVIQVYLNAENKADIATRQDLLKNGGFTLEYWELTLEHAKQTIEKHPEPISQVHSRITNMTGDMFLLAKENHVGCEQEAINQDFIKNSLEQFKYTPFKSSEAEEMPEIQLDAILEQITKSITDLAFDLEYDTCDNFLQMVDLAVIDLSIQKYQFKNEEDVRTAMITEDEAASTSDRRGNCHAGLSKLINDIIDKGEDCDEEDHEEHHHMIKADCEEKKEEEVVEDLLGNTGVSIINEVPVAVVEPEVVEVAQIEPVEEAKAEEPVAEAQVEEVQAESQESIDAKAAAEATRVQEEQAAEVARIETERLAAEAEDARIAEEKRVSEEAAETTRLAEEKKVADEAETVRVAEEKRVADEAVETARVAEEKRVADEAETARVAEEKRVAEEAAAALAAEESAKEAADLLAAEEAAKEKEVAEAQVQPVAQEENKQEAEVEAPVEQNEAVNYPNGGKISLIVQRATVKVGVAAWGEKDPVLVFSMDQVDGDATCKEITATAGGIKKKPEFNDQAVEFDCQDGDKKLTITFFEQGSEEQKVTGFLSVQPISFGKEGMPASFSMKTEKNDKNKVAASIFLTGTWTPSA